MSTPTAVAAPVVMAAAAAAAVVGGLGLGRVEWRLLLMLTGRALRLQEHDHGLPPAVSQPGLSRSTWSRGCKRDEGNHNRPVSDVLTPDCGM